ncbi:MAG: hypothetical protein ABR549_17645 [Mycobacteriales bacterium]
MRTCLRLGLAASLAMLASMAPTAADAQSTFSALTSSTAVDVTVSNVDFPLMSSVQAAGPAAGATLTSTGQGTAFASNPYPGTTVAELPGTTAGLTGAPIPDYPLYVATTTGDSPASYSRPGVQLKASCTESGPRCDGSSLAGSAPATTHAEASVVQASADKVTATATADVSSLEVPGGVTLTGTHTAATAVLDHGKLTRRSTLTVSRLTVAGSTTAYAIHDGKVVLAGSEAPVPFSALAGAMKAAGVEAELFSASGLQHGVVAPVLRLSTSLPGAPVGLTHPSQVVVTVGGAAASVGLGGYYPTLPTTIPPAPGVTVAPGPPAAAPVLSAPGPVQPASEPAPLAPAVVAAAPPPVVPAVTVAAPEPLDLQSFHLGEVYLALVLCAAGWLAATQAVRTLGMRFLWMS